jgi:hypothetical protein
MHTRIQNGRVGAPKWPGMRMKMAGRAHLMWPVIKGASILKEFCCNLDPI